MNILLESMRTTLSFIVILLLIPIFSVMLILAILGVPSARRFCLFIIGEENDSETKKT